MDERRRHEPRRLGPDAPDGDGAWDRVRTVCELVRHHVLVDAVAVSIAHGRWATTVATDEWAERLEEYQHTVGDGPSAAVVASGLAVLAPDVLARRSRWPVFAERAAAQGLAAVFAVPVPRADSSPLGTLTLYRRSTGALSVSELRHTAVMAGFTAKLIELDDVADSAAVRGRLATIVAATDALALRHTVTRDDALVLLRARAYAQDRPVHEVAAAVVDRDPPRG